VIGDDPIIGLDLGDAVAGGAEVGDEEADDVDDADEADPAAATVVGAAVAGAPAAAGGAAEESDDEAFVYGDDDEDLPAAQVAVAGATSDPVKDYPSRSARCRCSMPSRKSSWPSGSRLACSPRRSWPTAAGRCR